MYNNGQNRNSQNKEFARKAKKNKSSDNFVVKWSLAAIILSVIISLAILLTSDSSNIIKDSLNNMISSIQNKSGLPAFPIIGSKQNILLLGVDSNGSETDPFKGTRSDTIILLTIDPFSKTASAISIPRDSKVFLADNHGLDKINAAHAFGGPKLTIKTVENTFGVKIDHYIAVNFKGIKEVVGAVGGVPVYVEKRMRYVDNSGGLRINLYPGYQVLDPDQAEGYLRFRHDAIGDIGRVKRQQWFIRGIAKKLQSPEMIVKIPEIIQIAGKYIRTDMNFYELSRFAAEVKSINLDNLQSATLPGKPSNFGRISYWVLDTEKTQEIIDNLVYKTNSNNQKDSPLTVSILYSSDSAGKLDYIKSILAKSGYDVTCTSRSRDPHGQILGHTSYVSPKIVESLKKEIPELSKAPYILSPNNYPCGESDLSLVLADN